VAVLSKALRKKYVLSLDLTTDSESALIIITYNGGLDPLVTNDFNFMLV